MRARAEREGEEEKRDDEGRGKKKHHGGKPRGHKQS